MKNEIKTSEPVQPGNFTGVMPEFGRTADLQRHSGIRRGTAYNLLLDGKCERVIAEVESAAKEGRIRTTPAQYSEQIWKEFAP